MADALTQFLGWVSPIASTVIVTALTAQIKARQDAAERKRDEAQAETEAKRKAEAEWRERMDGSMADIDAKLDVLNEATQTTMRTTLLHYIEKYLTRGWVTPEERASLMDMHRKYAALNANGFIDGYMARVAELPDREI
jgi:hypothetical protein